MNTGRLVFAQLLDLLPVHEFNRCVRRYRGNFHCRSLSCYDQFLCMAFAQLTYRESLRDIETCLQAMEKKLCHAGLRGSVARSTLADANERRDWRIYADFAQVLIARARKLYAPDAVYRVRGESFGVELTQTAYVLDATIIDLCLSLFPWAQFQHGKGAIKLHTLMDLRGNIPCVLWVTHARIVDPAILDQILPEPGSIYIMDRGYVDFGRLRRFAQGSSTFIIRAKKNLRFLRLAYRAVDKSTGLRSDQTIRLVDPKTARRYPEPLRRIHYFDSETANRIVVLTNNFSLPALTVARLYKCRWQVELFFKWIKQHLRIKAFYGTSTNAVKTQTWIAISIYVLVAIAKKELRIERSLVPRCVNSRTYVCPATRHFHRGFAPLAVENAPFRRIFSLSPPRGPTPAPVHPRRVLANSASNKYANFCKQALGEILQILSLTLFEKEPILQLLSQRPLPNPQGPVRKHLSLFTI